MKVLTKNFRLNALANCYAAVVHQHIVNQNGGDFFYTQADGATLMQGG